MIEVNDRYGHALRLRPALRTDRSALVEGYARLSPESRQHRFFSGMSTLPDVIVDRLTAIDGQSHLAWALFDPTPGGADDRSTNGLGVGVVHVFRSVVDQTTGEMAIAVADDYQRRGLGRLLVGVAGAAAAAIGLSQLTATILATNLAMLRLARQLGGRPQRDPDDVTVFHVDLDTAALTETLPPGLADAVRAHAGRDTDVRR